MKCTVFHLRNYHNTFNLPLIFIVNCKDNNRNKAVCIISFQKLFMVGKSKAVTSFETLLKYSGQASPYVPIDPRNDVAFLPYSSGTTGKSTQIFLNIVRNISEEVIIFFCVNFVGKQKGVLLTHYNIVATTCQAR